MEQRKEHDFVKMKKIFNNPLLPFVYRYLNFSAKYLLPKSFGDHKISKQTLRQNTNPFDNSNQRNGTLAVAKSLLNDQDWFEELWNKRGTISYEPALFICGMKNPVIKLDYPKVSSGFVNSNAIQLQTCGHFPQEEELVAVADSIPRLLATKNYYSNATGRKELIEEK